MVSVTFDPEANALYFKFGDQKPVKTIPMGEGKYVDIAQNGEAVGVEVIFPSSSAVAEAVNAFILQKEQIKILQ